MRANSFWHVTESVFDLGPKMWDIVPNEIRESDSSNAFKFKIKRCVPEECPCRIYKHILGKWGL